MPTKKEEKTLNQKITDLDNKVEWFYGDDFKLEIMFDKFGFKRLMANYTPLDII